MKNSLTLKIMIFMGRLLYFTLQGKTNLIVWREW